MMLGHAGGIQAQGQNFTFMGDYDRMFAAPLGYYVEQQDPYPGSNDEELTYFQTSELLPDGSIIAGGRFVETALRGDFYLKTFMPTGALDTTFGTGGYVRTNFNNRFDGVPGTDQPQVLKVQPDGKILFAGYCTMLEPSPTSGAFGPDACVMRYNANGTLDTTFGGGTLVYNYAAATWTAQLDPGKVIFQTGLIASGQSFGTEGTYYDMAIQPDGKIVLVGETRNYANFLAPQGYGAIIVRLNPNGSLDSTFGSGGIRQHSGGCGSVVCGFGSGGRLQIKAIQPDGKILAVDGGGGNRNIVRYNPDGSSDQSFGNWSFDGVLPRGGLRVLMTTFEGISRPFTALDILVRPNGRINLIGDSEGFPRAAVTQQNTVFENGIYSDFESDGKANFSVFRDGAWYWLGGTNNQNNGVQFGIAGDKPAPADYDGDGKTDIAVFRNGAWYILRSSNGQVIGISFGTTGDLPRPGDFDGDGLADICVWRPSTGVWYILYSSNNQFNAVAFGTNGDVPLLADFDGDGRSDISVYRNGTWYWLRSSDGGFRLEQFGQAGDIPVTGDYDADSKFDQAVFRPANGTWYSLRSQTGFTFTQFGQNGDKPVPGDYDNDGKHDLAIYRGGAWYVLQSGDNSVKSAQFGAPTDVPVPAAYLP